MNDALTFDILLLVCLKVSEMKGEYFPPREDVILQNEAPTDFYILVTGTLVKKFPFSEVFYC